MEKFLVIKGKACFRFRHVLTQEFYELYTSHSTSEIVETVQYLAAPASGFVTGQIITVDGGRCLLDPVSSPFH